MKALFESLGRMCGLGTSRPESLKDLRRRNAVRYPVFVNRASLGWWEGEAFLQSGAKLENLSQTGALLVAEGLPPVGVPVWFRLEEPMTTDWVESRVVVLRDSNRVGVVFRETCPYQIFKAIVPSYQSNGINPNAISPEFETGAWR